MMEESFGDKKTGEEKEYTGEMQTDPRTGEVVTPEEAERRRKDLMENGPEQR